MPRNCKEEFFMMKVIDMHCDTISELLRLREKGTPEGLRRNKRHIDLVRMKEGQYLLQNFALFVLLKAPEGQEYPGDGQKQYDPWERVCSMHALYQEELEKNQDIVAPVLRYGDIAANEAAGKLSSLLTVEEGGVCAGRADRLKKLYQMGVRMMTLTWNFDNEIGHPNQVPELTEQMKAAMREWKKWKGLPADTPGREQALARTKQAVQTLFHTPEVSRGLTETGREFVWEMERMGMIIDVSHLSDAGFYDVLKAAQKPFVASHSNARAVCPHVRNMTDDMIRALSERGGVMGLNFCADFLEEKPFGVKNPGTIDAVVRHARHIASVGGIEVLGLGSDFDGIDTHEELPGAQSMGALWEALHRAGFSQDQLDQIFYKNVLRVYQDTLA